MLNFNTANKDKWLTPPWALTASTVKTTASLNPGDTFPFSKRELMIWSSSAWT